MRRGLPGPGFPEAGSIDPEAMDAVGVRAEPVRPVPAIRRTRSLLSGIVLIGLVLASRGLTNEGLVSLQGDMPRYMMNGVFFYDLLLSGGAWSVEGLQRFAEHYYAKYPALSLGHHPPLLAAALAPVYAVMGVSVFSSRIVILACLAIATIALFALTRRLYDDRVALWAALLFVTNPVVTSFGQAVMSEMPMIALVLLATSSLVRFRDTGRSRDYAWFILMANASLYAKQLAVFVAPVYVLLLLVFVGWRRLFKPDVFWLTVLGVVLCAPIVVMTYVLSPFNVAMVRFISSQTGSAFGLAPQPSVLWAIMNGHLSLPVIGIVICGAIAAILRLDRRVLISLLWMSSVLLSVLFVTGRIDPPRYGFVAMPAYFLCAAGLLASMRSMVGRRVATAALAFAVGWQLWAGRKVTPTGAEGYEAAAQYVLSQPASSPTILFSGPVDTGYFVFFVRKHDPAGQHVVLRSDKLLTTSRMGRSSVKDRIMDRQEIYGLLRAYGTRFVVIEDQPSDSQVLDWLREELTTDRFIERHRIPIGTTDKRLRGVSLAIYEYRDAQPPDPDVNLELSVPLVRRTVRVPLDELIDVGRQ